MPSTQQIVARLRFRHLALLVALREHGSLHRAAASVHMAQPSASKLIHELEGVLGFKLFDRLPRGMRPTPLGEEVLAFAKNSLAALQRLCRDLDEKHQGGFGQLVIGAIMGAAPDVVARAMAETKQRRPLLVLKLLGETSDEVLTLLLERKVDVGVGRFNAPLQHNQVDYEALGNETLYVVARIGHPLAQVEGLSLRTLQDSPWILQALPSPARQLIEQQFGEADMPTPPNIVESASIFATLQLLQTSDAVTLLPESVVRDHLRAGLLVRLPVDVGNRLPAFGILTRRGEPLSAAANEFIESLRHFASRLERGAANTENYNTLPVS